MGLGFFKENNIVKSWLNKSICHATTLKKKDYINWRHWQRTTKYYKMLANVCKMLLKAVLIVIRYFYIQMFASSYKLYCKHSMYIVLRSSPAHQDSIYLEKRKQTLFFASHSLSSSFPLSCPFGVKDTNMICL